MFTGYPGNLCDQLDIMLAKIMNNLDVTFIAGQPEQCPKTKRLHIQGMIHFNKPMRLRAVVDVLTPIARNCHVEQQRGTNDEALAYCHKDDTCMDPALRFQRGTMNGNDQGKRNDLHDAVDAVKNEPSDKTVFNVICQSQGLIRYIHHLKSFAQMGQQPRRTRTWGVWIWGPAGNGKSRMVADICAKMGWSTYQKPIGKWWDRYTGQDAVILDNFNPKEPGMTYDFLCKLCDEQQLTLEIKGGTVQMNAQVVFITTVWNPGNLFMQIKHNDGADPSEWFRRHVSYQFTRNDRNNVDGVCAALNSKMNAISRDYGYSTPPLFNHFITDKSNETDAIDMDFEAYQAMLREREVLQSLNEQRLRDLHIDIPATPPSDMEDDQEEKVPLKRLHPRSPAIEPPRKRYKLGIEHNAWWQTGTKSADPPTPPHEISDLYTQETNYGLCMLCNAEEATKDGYCEYCE